MGKDHSIVVKSAPAKGPNISRFSGSQVGGLIVTLLTTCFIANFVARSKLRLDCGKKSSGGRLNDSNRASVSYQHGLVRPLEQQACAQIAAVRKLETIPEGATRSLEQELHHQEMLLYLETDLMSRQYQTSCGDTPANAGNQSCG